MEGEIVGGSIGSAVKYKVEFKGGALLVEIDAPAGISNVTKIPALAVLEALKAAVPGTLDDAVIGVIEQVISK